MRRGFPTAGRPRSGLRSGRSGRAGGGPTSRSLPTLTLHRGATAKARHSRAARAGAVLWGDCHGHPPRLGHVQRCAPQPRRPYQRASHPSGGQSVRMHPGSSWPSPHQAPSVQARGQSRERNAVPSPRPRCPPCSTNARSQDPRAGPAGWHVAPWLIRSKGGQPRRTSRRQSPRASRPRSVSPSTVPSDGSAGDSRRTRRHHARRHAPGWCAGRMGHAPGIAHPRETTQTASTTHRSPQAGASRARASGVPVQRETIHQRQGTQQGVTSRVCRLAPAVWEASQHHS